MAILLPMGIWVKYESWRVWALVRHLGNDRSPRIFLVASRQHVPLYSWISLILFLLRQAGSHYVALAGLEFSM